MTRAQTVKKIGVLLLLVGAGAVIWSAVTFVRVALRTLEGEKQLQAWYLATALVREHVEAEGAWPRDWAELERMTAREQGWFQWPADAEEVREYVVIDFGVAFTGEAITDSPAMSPQKYLNEGIRTSTLAELAKVVEVARSGDNEGAD